MRLEIIIGDREYLRPKPVRRERVERMARRIAPEAVVPRAAWATEDDPYCDAFVTEDPATTERRSLLLLDYLEDVAPPGAILCVVLPFESSLVPDRSKLYDPRAREFVALAQRQLGEDNVGCTRFGISANTENVLEALAARRHAPDAVAEPFSLHSPVPTIFVQTKVSHPEDYSEMWTNYSRSIVALGEPLVEPGTIFGGRDRPDIIAQHLERTQLLVRPDVPPDKVLAELSPGGGLHALFSRPLPFYAAEG